MLITIMIATNGMHECKYPDNKFRTAFFNFLLLPANGI